MKKHKVVFLFSGQGSQYRNAGKELFASNEAFRSSIKESDLIFKKYLHRSLVEELYNKADSDFDELLITHPAIVAIEIAMIEVMKSYSIFPDYVFGQSLGEFAAGVAAGVWSASTAIKAAMEQSKSLIRSNIEGGMLTVIDAEGHHKSKTYEQYSLCLASDNFQRSFTVSGTAANLDQYQKILKREEIIHSRIPVTVPFHSPLIDEGLNDFSCYMKQGIDLENPKVPYVSGLTSNLVTHIDADYYNKVVSRYFNFSKTISFVEELGACLYIDLGPSGTSATFAKYSISKMSESKIQPILSPFGNELMQLEKLNRLISNRSDYVI
ncbi:acyltransferase domain-containing protein [Flavobacterium poyangense]|uniref:acyltransferase domain-containing protein n=1 Tax=Flavobacterium poyangense TaxID=2204302 RepID=UPI00141FF374|nr:acyltransferase domain-containing protein [Flavobacterium sp. JXAS1]